MSHKKESQIYRVATRLHWVYEPLTLLLYSTTWQAFNQHIALTCLKCLKDDLVFVLSIEWMWARTEAEEPIKKLLQ